MELLKTKFHIPEPGTDTHLVLRAPLIEMLRTHSEKQLLLVQAPAGYGKTTLLSQWISTQNAASRTCWYSIDRMDNRLRVFWSYFFTAIAAKHSGLCRSAQFQLESANHPHIRDIIISALNELASCEQKVVIVLDDYHLIHAGRIHESLNFLLDHPLKNLSIIISSREKPKLDYSRLRLSGRMFELDKSHLKFTDSETAQFFSRKELNRLTEEQRNDLFQKTEGWAAAIRLFALNPESFRQVTGTGFSSGLLVHDYMWEELYRGLDQGLKHFLTAICIVDRFCPQLCRKVSGDAETQAHLQYLIRNQFFIIPLDGEDIWFRFHHLFQDFLKSGFSRLSIEKQKQYHLRASVFFNEHHFFDEAFRHALEARDEQWAGKILTENISALYGSGSDELVSSYLEQISEKTIFSDPVLSGYYLGFKIFSGDFDRIDQMEQLISGTNEEGMRQTATGFYLAFKAYRTFCVDGDLDNTIALSEQAKRHLPREHGAMIRMLDYIQTISYRYSGQIQKAIPLCLPGKDDDLLTSVLVGTNSADLDIELGRLNVAHKTISSLIDSVETLFDTGTLPAMFGFLYIIMGKIYKLKNRINDARTCFSKGISIIKNSELLEIVIISLGEYAQFLMICGEYPKALENIDQAINMSKKQFSWVEHLMQAAKQWIFIRQEKLDPVSVWAASYPVGKHCPIPPVQSDEYLVVARYYIAVRDFERAGRIIESFITKDLREQRHGRLMECYVIKAKIMYCSGNASDAEKWLLKAFELSEKEEWVSVYLQDFDGMENLFRDIQNKGQLPGYLEPHLIFPGQETDTPRPEEVVIYDYIEKFNQRETDLLKLFQQGLSNREAAYRMCLSVNTVRWYASRIFSKLDVKRRGQAVLKAVEYGLI